MHICHIHSPAIDHLYISMGNVTHGGCRYGARTAATQTLSFVSGVVWRLVVSFVMWGLCMQRQVAPCRHGSSWLPRTHMFQTSWLQLTAFLGRLGMEGCVATGISHHLSAPVTLHDTPRMPLCHSYVHMHRLES